MRKNLIATAYCPNGAWGGGNPVVNSGTIGCTVTGNGSLNDFYITVPLGSLDPNRVRVVCSPGFGSRVTGGVAFGVSGQTIDSKSIGFSVTAYEATGLLELPFKVDVYEVLTDYGP